MSEDLLRTFAIKVKQMRAAQKNYYKNKSNDNLQEILRLQYAVDVMVVTFENNGIIYVPKSNQIKAFE